MYLESPQLLLLLWLLPVVGGLLFYAQRRRAAAARHFAGEAMLHRLMPVVSGGRYWTKSIVLLVGLGLLIFAAARPRWGAYFEDVQTRGVDMFVLLDVSRSMLAEDVAPNRLERAKSDIRDLLQYLKGDRVGLIAFAGAAVVQTPLTTDQGFFQMVLDDTDADSAPRGGSLIGDAIRKALEAMEPRHDRDQVIVLITDGEDHDSFPAEAAKAAAERDVKVICVGLGDTEEGMRIPIRDEAGGLSYMKHDGQEVWSKMDETLLKEIALTTKGAYIPAKTRAYDLGQVYADHLAGLTRGEITAEKRKRYRERFQLFVVLGLTALLLEMVIARSPKGSPRRNQKLLKKR
jgi:Ca-activated chloride channel family protein